MTMVPRFLFPIAIAARHINRTICSPCNVLCLSQINGRRYKSSDVTGVAFSPLPDAELKIQLYYKKQQIKKRKEKLKEIAQSIWNNNPNVNYAGITFEECKKMYEEHTGQTPGPWEAKQIYRLVTFIASIGSSCFFFCSVTLEQYAPWRYFQEEKERQKHVTVMIEEVYKDLQKEVKQGNDLTLSKSDLTVLLERKLGELPSSNDIEDMWMDRFRIPLVKWLE